MYRNLAVEVRMKISVGNPLEGDDFFDREQEQVRVWRKLEGSHLLMLAPRRIGRPR
jgi:hypothetical protein